MTSLDPRAQLVLATHAIYNITWSNLLFSLVLYLDCYGLMALFFNACGQSSSVSFQLLKFVKMLFKICQIVSCLNRPMGGQLLNLLYSDCSYHSQGVAKKRIAFCNRVIDMWCALMPCVVIIIEKVRYTAHGDKDKHFASHVSLSKWKVAKDKEMEAWDLWLGLRLSSPKLPFSFSGISSIYLSFSSGEEVFRHLEESSEDKSSGRSSVSLVSATSTLQVLVKQNSKSVNKIASKVLKNDVHL